MVQVNRLVMTDGTFATMLMKKATLCVSGVPLLHLVRHMVASSLTGIETRVVTLAMNSALATVRAVLLFLLMMPCTDYAKKAMLKWCSFRVSIAYSSETSGNRVRLKVMQMRRPKNWLAVPWVFLTMSDVMRSAVRNIMRVRVIVRLGPKLLAVVNVRFSLMRVVMLVLIGAV